MIKLETKRLILREWQDADVEPMYAINQDPKVMECFPELQDLDRTKKFVNGVKGHFDKYGYGLYAVEIKENNEFIGFVGLNLADFDAHFTPAVEIGWRLSSKHWGYGYATEAAKFVLHYAFTVLKINEIVSFTVPVNLKSISVMKKIGLVLDHKGDFMHPNLPEGHQLQQHILYKLNREEYLNE